jgi:hypothetical protein
MAAITELRSKSRPKDGSKGGGLAFMRNMETSLAAGVLGYVPVLYVAVSKYLPHEIEDTPTRITPSP